MALRNPEDLPAFSILSVLATIRRQWLWMLLTTLAGIALTVIVTLRQRPVYEARASIRLAEQKNAGIQPDVLTALTGPSSIETEMEILRSRSVSEDVVDSLQLQAKVVEPKGEPRQLLFGRLELARDATPGIYTIERDTTVFTVTTPEGHSVGGAYGAPVTIAGVLIEPLPLADGPRRVRIAVSSPTAAAEAVRADLKVTRPQTNAGIVVVSYRSSDPQLAAAVVNGVANSYIGLRTRGQKQQYRAAVDFLQGQVQRYGTQLAEAEGALEQFRRANSIVDPDAQAGDEARRLADLKVQQEELTARRGEMSELVRRTRQRADSSADWTAFAASPALVQNPTIASVVQQLTTAEGERAQLLARRTGADPDVVTLTQRIATLRLRLSALANATLQSLGEQARQLDATLSHSRTRLARVPEAQLQDARLQRRVTLVTELYTLLQTRLNESQISEAMEIANVELVDPALVPSRPLAARRIFNLLFGTALALLIGIIVAVVRESNDTSVRSRAEVAQLTMVPLLASIPRIDLRNGRRKEVAARIEDRLVIRHSPRSPAAEAYRALRTNVAFATNGQKRQLRSLVVTSPEPEDGKTTTALNLAVTMADQGIRTVLIAADQRRPVLHKVLHTERSPGLSDLLNGTTTLEQAIRFIPLGDLASGAFAFIPAGHHVSNPAELLGSPAMRSLLESLAESYDTVILDTPPLCVVTDAAVLGTQADGVLVVARMGATHAEALQQAVEEMKGLGARVVGTVLTDVNQREDRYGYRYGYYQTYYEEDSGNGNGRTGERRSSSRKKSRRRV